VAGLVLVRPALVEADEGVGTVTAAAPGRHTVGVTHPPDQELFDEEDRLWTQLNGLVGSLPLDEVTKPGYFQEGWSAKDLIGHIGSWLAEAGVVLEQINAGTYRPDDIDVDEMNKVFYESMHDVAFADVRAQTVAARNRMLRAWRSLPEHSADADRWISKSGPEHYAEHLPRLEEWIHELRGSA
jgi:hypothetical protein